MCKTGVTQAQTVSKESGEGLTQCIGKSKCQGLSKEPDGGKNHPRPGKPPKYHQMGNTNNRRNGNCPQYKIMLGGEEMHTKEILTCRQKINQMGRAKAKAGGKAGEGKEGRWQSNHNAGRVSNAGQSKVQ